MKKEKIGLLLELAIQVTAGMLVGGVISKLTLDHLDRELEQMIVARQSNGKAGVIAAVDAIRKDSSAPYKITIEEEPVATSQAGLDFTDEESQQLMKLAMAEAENQGVIGKALVMCVVKNRVESDQFPNTIEDVIFQPGQFSPVSDGRYYEAVPDEECYEALEWVINYWDGSAGALYFEANYSTATWHKENLEELFTYCDVTFYK
ncbi:MAG: cell wall hydrolase [Pseudobutyrivibrio ruminis]|nr:cell wall hydrolase [Pseudobutyrivibrio ruminis]